MKYSYRRWLVMCLAWFSLHPANADEPAHLRLQAALDRPQDGYCVDIPGGGQYLRVDLPLFAHNCKPALTSDSAVSWTSEGRLFFPGARLCMTVAGVNGRALPGASVLLRECGQDTVFFDVAALQRFTLHTDGRLTLTGTDLCLAVGTESATTYSPRDAWRTLFVDRCATAAPARARWLMQAP